MTKNTTQWTLIAAGLVVLLAIPSVYGQTRRAIADVPFPFAAGDTVLPAGKYFVGVDPERSQMQLVSEDGASRVLLMVHRGDRKIPADRAALVFKRYGASRFLGRIALSGETGAYELPLTRTEREMAKVSRPSEEVASIPMNAR